MDLIRYFFTMQIASGVVGHTSGQFLCFLILPLLAFSINQLFYIGMEARIWLVPNKLMKNLTTDEVSMNHKAIMLSLIREDNSAMLKVYL